MRIGSRLMRRGKGGLPRAHGRELRVRTRPSATWASVLVAEHGHASQVRQRRGRRRSSSHAIASRWPARAGAVRQSLVRPRSRQQSPERWRSGQRSPRRRRALRRRGVGRRVEVQGTQRLRRPRTRRGVPTPGTSAQLRRCRDVASPPVVSLESAATTGGRPADAVDARAFAQVVLEPVQVGHEVAGLRQVETSPAGSTTVMLTWSNSGWRHSGAWRSRSGTVERPWPPARSEGRSHLVCSDDHCSNPPVVRVRCRYRVWGGNASEPEVRPGEERTGVSWRGAVRSGRLSGSVVTV